MRTDFTSDLYSVGVMMHEMLSSSPLMPMTWWSAAITDLRISPGACGAGSLGAGGAGGDHQARHGSGPKNRCKERRWMLEALNAYVENPAIVFNYTYLPDEIPEKVVEPLCPEKNPVRARQCTGKRQKKEKAHRVPAGILYICGLCTACARPCAG